MRSAIPAVREIVLVNYYCNSVYTTRCLFCALCCVVVDAEASAALGLQGAVEMTAPPVVASMMVPPGPRAHLVILLTDKRCGGF